MLCLYSIPSAYLNPLILIFINTKPASFLKWNYESGMVILPLWMKNNLIIDMH